MTIGREKRGKKDSKRTRNDSIDLQTEELHT